MRLEPVNGVSFLTGQQQLVGVSAELAVARKTLKLASPPDRFDAVLAEVPPDFKERVAGSVNAELVADRRIEVKELPREEAFAIPDIIRTATNLLPPDIEVVRIVDIVGLDTQADGGTHVASTALVGRVEVVKVENKGRGFRRLRVRIV